MMNFEFEGTFFESSLETERSLIHNDQFEKWLKAHCKLEEFDVQE